MLIYSPKQVMIITCKGPATQFGRQEEREEQIALHWQTPSSTHPPTYTIVLRNELAAKEMIEKSKIFAVNFIPFSLAPQVQAAMKGSPLNLPTTECDKIDCSRLKDPIGWLECELIMATPVGNCTMFTGKVVNNVHVREDKRLFHVQDDEFTTTQ